MSTETLKYGVEILQRAPDNYRVIVTQGYRYVGAMDTTTIRGCTTIAGLLMTKDVEDRDDASN